VPVAGVSTLAALAAGAPGALPVVDARRQEVFVLRGEPQVLAPGELEVALGTVCVGSGAVRYRRLLEAAGAEIPADTDERHIPRARFHAQLAQDFRSAEEVEPLYLRIPDADRTRG
jgi:tRNA threonylcarbamoyladenosine biosynthesis protein TsaB